MSMIEQLANPRDVYNHLVATNDRMFEAVRAERYDEYRALKESYDTTAEQNHDVVKYLENVKTSFADTNPGRAASAARALRPSLDARFETAGIRPDFMNNPGSAGYWQLKNNLDSTTARSYAAAFRDPSNAEALKVKNDVDGVAQQLQLAGRSTATLGQAYTQYRSDFGEMAEKMPAVAQRLFGISQQLGVASPTGVIQLHQGLARSLQGTKLPDGSFAPADDMAANMVSSLSDQLRGSTRAGGTDRLSRVSTVMEAVNTLTGNGVKIDASNADSYTAKLAEFANTFSPDAALQDMEAQGTLHPEDVQRTRNALMVLHLDNKFSGSLKPAARESATDTLRQAFPGSEEMIGALSDRDGLVSGLSKGKMDANNPIYRAMYEKGAGAKVPDLQKAREYADRQYAQMGSTLDQAVPGLDNAPAETRKATTKALADNVAAFSRAFTEGDATAAAEVSATLTDRMAKLGSGPEFNQLQQAKARADEIVKMKAGEGSTGYSSFDAARKALTSPDTSRPGADLAAEFDDAVGQLVRQYDRASRGNELKLNDGPGVRIEQVPGATPINKVWDAMATTAQGVGYAASAVASLLSQKTVGEFAGRDMGSLLNSDNSPAELAPIKQLIMSGAVVRDSSTQKLVLDPEKLKLANARWAEQKAYSETDHTVEFSSGLGRRDLKTPDGQAALLSVLMGAQDKPRVASAISKISTDWSAYDAANRKARKIIDEAGITNEYLESRKDTQQMMHAATGRFTLQSLLPGGNDGIKPEVAAQLAFKREEMAQRGLAAQQRIAATASLQLGKLQQGAQRMSQAQQLAIGRLAKGLREDDLTRGGAAQPVEYYLEQATKMVSGISVTP